MILNTPLKDQPKYLFLIKAFGIGISPYKNLRPREKEVLAWLYYYNFKNKDISEEHRNKIIFHKDTKENIAKKLSITIDNVYNILMVLKKQNLVEGSGDSMILSKKYLKPFEKDVSSLTFKFE